MRQSNGCDRSGGVRMIVARRVAPVAVAYQTIRMSEPTMTVRAFIESLRGGKYTSVGCYPKFWLCADGGTLSYEACMSDAMRIARAIRDNAPHDDWRVVGCDINWEDSGMYCEQTCERIESAYAE